MEPIFFTSEELASSPRRNVEAGDLNGAFLFGCGAVGRMMLDYYRDLNLEVRGFVDNNPGLQGSRVDGEPVISPQDFVKHHNDDVLVLAVSRGLREVMEQCDKMGVKHALPYYECVHRLGLLPFEKSMSPAEVEADECARAGWSIWDDPESREKYRRLVRFYSNFEYGDVLPYEEGQYFSDHYMPRKFLKALVDVGAFQGDTWESFSGVVGNAYDAYYGFEPDPGNFSILSRIVPKSDARARIFQTGLGDRIGESAMRAFGSKVSRLDDTGDVKIRVDTLDHLLGDSPVTLIKMDIEGGEPEALGGAEGLIRKKRPAMAISVYHRIDHFWRIPQWIKGLKAGYRLALGCHGYTNAEAICYAIPE